MSLWHELFSSVADSTRKYLNSLHGSQKQLRIRTLKPYRPNKMPDLPQSKPQVAEEKKGQTSAEGKQWFSIPDNIAERLKRTTINKVALLKKDIAFVEALYKLMAHWAETIQKTVLQITQSPLPSSALEEVAYWKDSERVLGSLLSELNDANIAKVDFILAGSTVHAKYLKELAGLKQACNQSKALALHLGPLEKHMRKLATLDGVVLVLPSLVTSLEGVQSCCPHLTKERAVELLAKISTLYAEDKVMETIRGEVTVQFFSRSDQEKSVEIVRKLRGIFESFLKSAFLAGESDQKRGATSIPGPRSFSFRPASAKIRAIPLHLSLRKLFLGCLAVCQDLLRMISLFDELRELREHPDLDEAAEEVLRIYTESKEAFDIFAEENSLQWEGLMQSLEERVRTVKRGPVAEVEVAPELLPDSPEDDFESSLVETQWKVF